MSNVIDRRKNTKGKSTSNRHRFLKRIENRIKKAIPGIIESEGIKDISSGKGKVKIPIKGIEEPKFNNDPNTGNKEYILPGNKKFREGDSLPKPPGGGKGSGNDEGGGSKDIPPGEDSFIVTISREEFLKYFFDDLELPNLLKKKLESTVDIKNKRSGFKKEGNPSSLNIHKTFKKSISRRLGIEGSIKKRIKELEAKDNLSDEDKEELEKLKKRLLITPFIDKIDLRYNNFQPNPIPATKAAMFCILDVSGSMGYHEKDIAKRFFTLLYIFLTKQYKNIDLIFIRHHTEAKEVLEEEFFNSREMGGTIVYSALELTDKIIKERYNDGNTNLYIAQASDGDVWGITDAMNCQDILINSILNKIQYMAYIEINGRASDSILWKTYEGVLQKFDNFSIKKLFNVNEIWTVFKQLFSNQS